MLAVSPLGNNHDHHQYHIHEQIQEENMESFGFHDFCNGNSLLDSIDFDDLFIGIHEGDVLPDLEMDPELLAEFSLTRNDESSTLNSSSVDDQKLCTGARDDDKVSGLSASDNNSDQCLNSRGEEVVSKMDDDDSVVVTPTRKEAANPSKGKKWKMGQSKNNDNAQGKRKVKKVDWTPELHRKFVQAVEQLGVDKAVPSRILELMGIDCLTRHNIASHLQKYRSHRKHLLAREAEAASWSQRRQMYGAVPVVAAAVTGGGGSKSRDVISPWLAPVVPATLGCFPPVTPSPMPHFRPLHVWGHPTTDQSRVNMWQKHHPPPPSTPPPAWPPAVPPHHHLPPENLYWPHQRVANVASAGTVGCFAPPLIPPTTRFGAPPVPGIPPHPMYKVKPIITTTSFGPAHQFPLDLHPSKESIDAAIGDVLSKPWLPMPLGLKPPSVDGVMGELHRQGVANIPPSCA